MHQDDGQFASLASDARLTAIADNVRSRHSEHAAVLNALVMAEEVGEAVQQIRRQQGLARSTTTTAEVAAELADVLIATAVTARLLDIDIAAAVDSKLTAIIARGGR